MSRAVSIEPGPPGCAKVPRRSGPPRACAVVGDRSRCSQTVRVPWARGHRPNGTRVFAAAPPASRKATPGRFRWPVDTRRASPVSGASGDRNQHPASVLTRAFADLGLRRPGPEPIRIAPERARSAPGRPAGVRRLPGRCLRRSEPDQSSGLRQSPGFRIPRRWSPGNPGSVRI